MTELSDQINLRLAFYSRHINQLIEGDFMADDDVSRVQLKAKIKSFFETDTRDELLTRDRFYLALGSRDSELNHFLVYYLQQRNEVAVNDQALWQDEWVRNFEKSYFDK